MMYFYASAMGNLKIFFSISLCIFKHHLVNCARKNFYKETNKQKQKQKPDVIPSRRSDRRPRFIWQLIHRSGGLLAT